MAAILVVLILAFVIYKLAAAVWRQQQAEKLADIAGTRSTFQNVLLLAKCWFRILLDAGPRRRDEVVPLVERYLRSYFEPKDASDADWLLAWPTVQYTSEMTPEAIKTALEQIVESAVEYGRADAPPNTGVAFLRLTERAQAENAAARDFLRRALARGPRPTNEVRREATEAGIPEDVFWAVARDPEVGRDFFAKIARTGEDAASEDLLKLKLNASHS